MERKALGNFGQERVKKTLGSLRTSLPPGLECPPLEECEAPFLMQAIFFGTAEDPEWGVKLLAKHVTESTVGRGLVDEKRLLKLASMTLLSLPDVGELDQAPAMLEKVKAHASNQGARPDVLQAFVDAWERMLPYADEARARMERLAEKPE